MEPNSPPSPSDVKADERGLTRYKRHIFICAGPKCCHEEQGLKMWEYLKARLASRGLTDAVEPLVYRSKVGCFRICTEGPICVVYPEAVWYRRIDEEAIDQIIQSHLIDGVVVEKYAFACNRNFSEQS